MRLKFRGREMASTELGFNVMKRAIEELSTMGTADAEPKLVGRNINVMLTALPANKRKLKFHSEAEAAKKGGSAASSEIESEESEATKSESKPKAESKAKS